jgi:tRNA-Thr(GGU) m(6)t(6)A37 methyltransferase TsaA
MNTFKLKPIGKVIFEEERTPSVQLKKEYQPAMKGLDGYSHVLIVWWLDRLATPELRQILTLDKPYTKGPDELGIFATRSPIRPNPIAVTVAKVVEIDEYKGKLFLAQIDAAADSPVLDIKPYYPNSDKVEHSKVPEWCRHWPQSVEESADFDWAKEFSDF